jgi:hypothetical protein
MNWYSFRTSALLRNLDLFFSSSVCFSITPIFTSLAISLPLKLP